MNLQEYVEFAVRMALNAGMTKSEAWDLALGFMGARS